MAGVSGTRVLVSGGAGFIGSNLVRRLLDLQVGKIAVVDNLLSSERDNLPDDHRIEFVQGSIAEDAVLEGLKDEYAYVFHLSTYHGNQSSIADPLADHANNTLTTLKLFERLKAFGKLKKVVYSSAGCGMAEKTHDAPNATEETDLVSIHQDSPYSMSKVFGEFYASYYYRRHGLPVVRARFQNVYGPGEVLGAGQWRGTPATVWRNVTPVFVYKALSGRALPLEDAGRTSRDFIYVDDIVEGLLACALRGKSGEAYNLASGKESSILDLAQIINRLCDNPMALDIRPAREWDRSGRRFGSTEKSRMDLGFEARVSLEEGLSRTISWTRENLPRIEKCMARHKERLDECAT